MLEVLFWLCLLAAGWSYFLYPMGLWGWVVFGRKTLSPGPSPASGRGDFVGGRGEEELPRLSLIVTVHNEEGRIGAKLANIAALDYPRERLEVLIASDNSTDGTDALVEAQAAKGIRLVRATERLGKEHAQLCAIRVASGEILVFSDVATEMPPDALRRLVRYFADPAVGAVSSEDRFISQDGRAAGEGLYVRYEMWLRRLESRAAGLVGLSGSFFAARRAACDAWDIHTPSDFNTALNCARLGLRAVTAPDVLGYYQDLKDPSREYARKVRTVLRGMTGLARHPEIMDPRRFGLFAWQVIGHKLMRWLVPWVLAALFVLNLTLLDDGSIYRLALLAQLLFYAAALLAHLRPALRELGPLRIVYFFVQVNVAIAQATLRLLRGERMSVWQPSAR
jgi:glycosyltransferase involved in cell wall biosynthesis